MLNVGAGLAQAQYPQKDLQVKLLIDIAKDNGLEITVELFKHIVNKVYGAGPLDKLFSAALSSEAEVEVGDDEDLRPQM